MEAASTAAAASASAALAASPAVPGLTPAAAARARKIAAGGMDFVERPNAVYISARNLAPPPAKSIVPVAPVDSLVSPVVSPELGPIVVPFSFLRWLSTSRSAWSWVVRVLGVAAAFGLVFACVKVYEAWLRDMQRRHEAREASNKARLERDGAVKQASTNAADSNSDVPAAATSTSSSAATNNFQALSTLLCSRYALLQRYASVLKHVQFPATASTAGASTALSSSTASPVALSDATKLKCVFDELESSLQENAYLKDLLRRINGQLAKG